MQNKVFVAVDRSRRPTSRGAPNDARKQSFHLGRVWNSELRKLRSKTTSEYICYVFHPTTRKQNVFALGVILTIALCSDQV